PGPSLLGQIAREKDRAPPLLRPKPLRRRAGLACDARRGKPLPYRRAQFSPTIRTLRIDLGSSAPPNPARQSARVPETHRRGLAPPPGPWSPPDTGDPAPLHSES